MDKPALDVIALALSENDPADWQDDPGDHYYNGLAEIALTALGANGYVVVPRHLLDELLGAVHSHIVNTHAGDESNRWLPLAQAYSAVVEAVGPTREDTK